MRYELHKVYPGRGIPPFDCMKNIVDYYLIERVIVQFYNWNEGHVNNPP